MTAGYDRLDLRSQSQLPTPYYILQKSVSTDGAVLFLFCTIDGYMGLCPIISFLNQKGQ